jgi:hypothetical protein
MPSGAVDATLSTSAPRATASTAAVAAGGAHIAEAGYKIGSAALAMAGLGGSGPVRAGQSGEAAVRAQYGDIGTKIRFRIDGDELIPDGTLGNVVSEVNTVGQQGLTHQIKQYMKIAEDMEGVLVLYTRHSTRISRVLREAIVEGKLFLKTF